MHVVLQLEDDLQKEVKQVRYALEGDLKSFGKGFTVIEQVIAPGLPRDIVACRSLKHAARVVKDLLPPSSDSST